MDIYDDYVITHDYYDHRDADKDINIVLPVQRLTDMAAAGFICSVAARHIGYMGHIDKQHIATLVNRSAPETARTVFLRGSFGHPLGEPFKTGQHAAILRSAFQALVAIQTPGTIIDLPFKWRRHQYVEPSWM